MRYAKTKTKRGAILAALEDFNRRQQMAELVAFSGTCKDLITFDELMEVRERDVPKAARLHSFFIAWRREKPKDSGNFELDR